MEYENKEVRFDIYCKRCKRAEEKESNDICDECLSYPVNEHSRKPRKFEPGNNGCAVKE